jgi:hypothetical protein
MVCWLFVGTVCHTGPVVTIRALLAAHATLGIYVNHLELIQIRAKWLCLNHANAN